MESKIIVALDFDSESKTLTFVDRVDPTQCRVKVGKELFTRCGPALVKQLVARNFDVFLDLKFHDIPNTVAHAVAAAADLGVWMTNVHASGGREMPMRLTWYSHLQPIDVTDCVTKIVAAGIADGLRRATRLGAATASRLSSTLT